MVRSAVHDGCVCNSHVRLIFRIVLTTRFSYTAVARMHIVAATVCSRIPHELSPFIHSTREDVVFLILCLPVRVRYTPGMDYASARPTSRVGPSVASRLLATFPAQLRFPFANATSVASPRARCEATACACGSASLGKLFATRRMLRPKLCPVQYPVESPHAAITTKQLDRYGFHCDG